MKHQELTLDFSQPRRVVLGHRCISNLYSPYLCRYSWEGPIRKQHLGTPENIRGQ